jgi:hypothetical protein
MPLSDVTAWNLDASQDTTVSSSISSYDAQKLFTLSIDEAQPVSSDVSQPEREPVRLQLSDRSVDTFSTIFQDATNFTVEDWK